MFCHEEGKPVQADALGFGQPHPVDPPSYEQDNSEKAARWFGLSRTDFGLQLGFFVGVQRLPGATEPLCVASRFKHMDYAAMFSACADHPTVSQHLDHTFYI